MCSFLELLFFPLQVTNEKVKALVELAQLKQENHLLQEYEFSYLVLIFIIQLFLFNFS